MTTEQNLSNEIIQWLNGMKDRGYEKIFSEALLIIPIAKHFREQGFDVKGDTDLYFYRSENEAGGKRGKINYDFYAKKVNGSSSEIILEMKWLKAAFESKRGSTNYCRIITDFVKLAIRSRNWQRLAVVARDRNLPLPSHKWFRQLMSGEKLELKIERKDDTGDINLAIKKSENYFEMKFDDKEERKRIYEQLRDYQIHSLEMVITPPAAPESNSSVDVMVFSIEPI